MKDSHYSESVEMYLKTLATLGGGSEPVPIARIAERMDVTTVSANEMMQRLARENLVAHQPYKGVTLTETGRDLAQNVIRRERLWERFLVDHLKLDWALAHEWACQLEHATAPEVIDALDAYLDYPAQCPQGNPIPRAGQPLQALRGPLLSEIAVGQSVRLKAFEDESAEVLSYLQKRGLTVGSIVTVTEIAPKHGPLTLALEGREVVLGVNLAASIRVELLQEASSEAG
ncbi:MAG: metal-dependent transcriptional regulator [Anaerolineales bacterium]|nr:metal-dependent transcriptional regulator [Anaerolineales bacterium]